MPGQTAEETLLGHHSTCIFNLRLSEFNEPNPTNIREALLSRPLDTSQLPILTRTSRRSQKKALPRRVVLCPERTHFMAEPVVFRTVKRSNSRL